MLMQRRAVFCLLLLGAVASAPVPAADEPTAAQPPNIEFISDDHASAQGKKPNVLFIAIDDQNDWIGHLGGHPLAKTPRIDRIAQRGTAFLNAHCQSPLCNPSRTSLMLSLRPTTTGVYGLAPWFRKLDKWKDRVTLAQHFKAHGYRTLTAGKIYHGSVGGPRQQAVEFDVWGPRGGIGAKPDKKLIPPTPMGNHPLMDWGRSMSVPPPEAPTACLPTMPRRTPRSGKASPFDAAARSRNSCAAAVRLRRLRTESIRDWRSH